MLVPRYWSEASHCERFPGRRQVTVRRFGWSSQGQADADVHARTRVEEALAVLRSAGLDGLQDFTRRERTVAYAGSDGLPIREEIVQESERTGAVVTRNSYGALCLNTTAAMFVDVDRPESRATPIGCVGFLAGAVAGGVVGAVLREGARAQGVVFGAIAGAILVAWGVFQGRRLWEGRQLRARDPVRWAVARTRTWCESHPRWRVVAYRTPAGARLLPVHAAFDAGDEATFEFMEFVGADPLYQRMCRLQKCFRARVSPKPWRIGIERHFRAGGTWPVKDPAKLRERARWVRSYDEAARAYASCLLVEVIGDGPADPRVEEIRALHDEMCRAGSTSDLA